MKKLEIQEHNGFLDLEDLPHTPQSLPRLPDGLQSRDRSRLFFPVRCLCARICSVPHRLPTSLRRAPLSMVETLQEAAYEQMQAEASQMAASSQLPEAQDVYKRQRAWSFQTSENTTRTCLWRKLSAFIRRFRQSE